MNRIRSYFGRLGHFSRNARLYLAGTFLMGLGQGAVFVHLNLYFRALGLGDAAIGRLLSTSSFGTVVIAIPAAIWIDRLPAERVFTLAATGFSLAFAAILLVPKPAVLLVASFFTGLMFTELMCVKHGISNSPGEDRSMKTYPAGLTDAAARESPTCRQPT